MKKWKAGKKQNFGKTNSSDLTSSGSRIVKETVFTGNTKSYTLVYLYDEYGSPIGFRYRTLSYSANVFDGYFFEKNIQGDIVGIWDQNGTKVVSYVYDAWGNVTVSGTGASGISAKNPVRYRGYYFDTETGLYYLQTRYYNPSWGRFINADAYLNANCDILGYNLFVYCNNNPIQNTDETGEFLGTIIGGIIGGISGGIIAAINGDNILAGIGIGAATGALSGFGVDLAVATGGVAGVAIAAVSGAVASGINYSATEFVNGRDIDYADLAIEASMGAVFNLLSFGVEGSSAAKAGESIISKMISNDIKTIFFNTTRKVAGRIVSKSAYGVAKNIVKNISYEFAMATVVWSGQFAFSKIFERWT